MIDLSAFETAIKTFDEIILRYDNESHDTAIRDALIQRFEYTYSLAIKILMRYLKEYLPELSDMLTFNQVIREANRLGLLRSNLEIWDNYRQKRNLSSHTYDEKIALEVVSITKDFNKEVHFLVNKLKSND